MGHSLDGGRQWGNSYRLSFKSDVSRTVCPGLEVKISPLITGPHKDKPFDRGSSSSIKTLSLPVSAPTGKITAIENGLKKRGTRHYSHQELCI